MILEFYLLLKWNQSYLLIGRNEMKKATQMNRFSSIFSSPLFPTHQYCRWLLWNDKKISFLFRSWSSISLIQWSFVQFESIFWCENKFIVIALVYLVGDKLNLSMSLFVAKIIRSDAICKCHWCEIAISVFFCNFQCLCFVEVLSINQCFKSFTF